MEAHAVSNAPPTPEGTSTGKIADTVATWDLEARHLLEWYPWPAEGLTEKLAASLVQQALQVRLMQDPTLEKSGARSLVNIIATPEGTFMAVSTSLTSDVDPGEIFTHVRDHIDRFLATRQSLVAIRQMFAFQHASLDLAAIRKQAGTRANDWLEANVLLQRIMMEQATGIPFENLVKAIGECDLEEASKIASRALAVERRSTLVLEPRE